MSVLKLSRPSIYGSRNIIRFGTVRGRRSMQRLCTAYIGPIYNDVFYYIFFFSLLILSERTKGEPRKFPTAVYIRMVIGHGCGTIAEEVVLRTFFCSSFSEVPAIKANRITRREECRFLTTHFRS